MARNAGKGQEYIPHANATAPRLATEQADNSGAVNTDPQFIADRLTILNQKLLVAGVMVAIGGCAGASTPSEPPGINVTGRWAGTRSFRNPAMGGEQVTADRKQDGAKVTGPMSVSGPTSAEPTNFEGARSAETSGTAPRPAPRRRPVSATSTTGGPRECVGTAIVGE
jgi:hypothetical protein